MYWGPKPRNGCVAKRLSGEILAQRKFGANGQNENSVPQSNKNMRQNCQKAKKSTLHQIKSAPKFLHLR